MRCNKALTQNSCDQAAEQSMPELLFLRFEVLKQTYRSWSIQTCVTDFVKFNEISTIIPRFYKSQPTLTLQFEEVLNVIKY